MDRKVATPACLPPGNTPRLSRSVYSDTKSDPLTHLKFNAPRHTFTHTSTIDVIYNAKNRSWQDIHDSISTTTTSELFDADFVSHESQPLADSIRINIPLNKHCMSELLLLDNTKVLCLFDTSSNVNLLSESVIKSRKHLSSLPVLDCPAYTIRNTTGEMKANKFIELCFRVKDDYILHTTALVVPDFGTVKLLLSICSMNNLNSVIDVSSRQISIRKISFIFKSSFHCKVKANDSRTINIKCSLPKELRNGNFVSRPFRLYSNYLPLTFMLQFRKGISFIRITNPTSSGLTIKPNTPLGCVSFELMCNLSDSSNIITHVHQDMDGCNAMFSQIMSDCPIHQSMGMHLTVKCLAHVKIHSITSHNHMTTELVLKVCIFTETRKTTSFIPSLQVLCLMMVNMSK